MKAREKLVTRDIAENCFHLDSIFCSVLPQFSQFGHLQDTIGARFIKKGNCVRKRKAEKNIYVLVSERIFL